MKADTKQFTKRGGFKKNLFFNMAKFKDVCLDNL